MAGQERTYNLLRMLRLTGPLDIEALRAAFALLIARHESLRTNFAVVGGNHSGAPIQVIAGTRLFELPVIEVDNDEVEKQARAHAEHGEVHAGATVRCSKRSCCGRDRRDHLLLINMHHIISVGCLVPGDRKRFGELQHFYAAKLAGSGFRPWSRYRSRRAGLRGLAAAAGSILPSLLIIGSRRALAQYEEGLALPYDFARPADARLAGGDRPPPLSGGPGGKADPL